MPKDNYNEQRELLLNILNDLPCLKGLNPYSIVVDGRYVTLADFPKSVKRLNNRDAKSANNPRVYIHANNSSFIKLYVKNTNLKEDETIFDFGKVPDTEEGREYAKDTITDLCGLITRGSLYGVNFGEDEGVVLCPSNKNQLKVMVDEKSCL